MKKLNLFLLLCAFVAGMNITSAQTLSKGHLVQEITDVSADDEQMAAQLQMMKGTQLDVYFDGKQNLSKLSMMGGMIGFNTLTNAENGSMKLFVDAMGQKMLVESTKEEMDAMGGDQAAMMKDMVVTYDEGDTKVILGYNCVKATVKNPAMDKGMSFSMYVSPEVKADYRLIQNMQYLELKGYPLEFTVDMGVMTLTTTTLKIEEAVNSEVFNISDAGYQKLTMEEFTSMMGGMGGGLGF